MKFIIINNNYYKSILLTKNIKNILKINNFIENINKPKYVFIIGGDGTLLKAVNKLQKIVNKVMFIIIKTGSLGFYSSCNINNFHNIIQNILNKKMYIKNLTLLEINFNKTTILYALNEIKLIDNIKTIKTNIFVNNELLEYFRGSGLVFATNNGSSGYMRSINGSIIATDRYKLWEMKEIAPIINSNFFTINSSIIFDNTQLITLKGKLINKKIIVDTYEYNITNNIIKIKISNKKIKIIYDPKNNLSKIKLLKQIFSYI